jgi:phage gpG-like protein
MTNVITINIKGDARLQRALRVVSELGRANSAEARGVMGTMGLAMQQKTAKTFRHERDPVTGLPWKKTGKLAMQSRPGGGKGGKTLWDTGQLAQSVVMPAPKISRSGDALSVTISTNKRYAGIHQDGGTIRPKKAKFLAIPINRPARRAGTARRWWQQNESKKPFIKKSKRGNLLIFAHEGDGIKPYFLLRESVVIPQRRFLGWSNDGEDARHFEKVIIDALNNAWGSAR